MANPLKYKIGFKVGEWIIIEIIKGLNLKYKIKCKCNFEKITTSSHMSRLTMCLDCKKKQNSSHMIGQKIGNFEILQTPAITGNSKYFVKCRCGHEYFTSLYQIKKSESCFNCKKGFYPGKIIDGCTFLERIKGIHWKVKCRCGTIYNGRSTSRFSDCGCSRTDQYFEEAKKKIGYKFGKLKVIDVIKQSKHNILVCKCKCGNTIEFINGHECKRNSCGCLLKENNPRNDKKGNSKFKNYEILSMRELFSSTNYTFDEIASMFNCDKHYLSRILKGTIWTSLPGFIPEFKRLRPKKIIKQN